VITVGIVSPGAMGSALGCALVAGGARVVATLDGRSTRTAQLVQGIELLPGLDDVLAVSDANLSIVSPGAALVVADAVACSTERFGARPLVGGLNAVAPATMHAVASRLGEAGPAAVDGSIANPPPRFAGATIVYLSGPRAAEFASGEGVARRGVAATQRSR
jgi:hypothetical protein